MSASPPTPSPFSILGPLLLVCAFLFVVTRVGFFGVCLIILTPFAFLSFVAWAFKGPFHHPFDPD